MLLYLGRLLEDLGRCYKNKIMEWDSGIKKTVTTSISVIPERRYIVMDEKPFEVMYKRLEEIAKEIQKTNISLDEATRLYKEGVELSQKCSNYIANLKREISSTDSPSKKDSVPF